MINRNAFKHGQHQSSSRVLAAFAVFLPIALMLTAAITLSSGNAAQSAYPGGTNYYFPWYDDQYGLTWVLTSNPAGGADAAFDTYLNNDLLSWDFPVAGGSSAFQRFAGRMGGPLMVNSHNGSAMVSERSLFGNSFEEIWATPYDELDSHYYWPAYECHYMNTWILVSNPPENGEDVYVDLKITTEALNEGDPKPPDILVQQHLVHPGESWTPIYPGTIGSPVEVKAYRVGGSPGNPADARKVIASERILIAGAFNEMPGIPASKLSSSYFWTWYDSVNSYNLLAVGNPNAYPVYATAYVGGVQQDAPYMILAGETAGWISNDPLMDGPVKVEGCLNSSIPCNSPANIYASQIVFYNRSYEEIAGTPLSDMPSTVNWTWYDMQTPGAQNWVLVANIQPVSIHYEITGPGISPAAYPEASGNLLPGANATPVFPGRIGGPLQVKAWIQGTSTPIPVMASQRVLWNGYFNEVVGKGL